MIAVTVDSAELQPRSNIWNFLGHEDLDYGQLPIYASYPLRTSRVAASCTTAGIRPLELNFAFLMMLFFVMLIEQKTRLLPSESVSICDLIGVSQE